MRRALVSRGQERTRSSRGKTRPRDASAFFRKMGQEALPGPAFFPLWVARKGKAVSASTARGLVVSRPWAAGRGSTKSPAPASFCPPSLDGWARRQEVGRVAAPLPAFPAGLGKALAGAFYFRAGAARRGEGEQREPAGQASARPLGACAARRDERMAAAAKMFVQPASLARREKGPTCYATQSGSPAAPGVEGEGGHGIAAALRRVPAAEGEGGVRER
jgi:hypothetical protein